MSKDLQKSVELGLTYLERLPKWAMTVLMTTFLVSLVLGTYLLLSNFWVVGLMIAAIYLFRKRVFLKQQFLKYFSGN